MLVVLLKHQPLLLQTSGGGDGPSDARRYNSDFED